MFGNKSAATYDVGFNVNLGAFRHDLGEVGNIYQRTTGQMSTTALRLSLAQERVAKAIATSGAESRSARAATLAYRREVESLARENSHLTQTTGHASSALAREERTLGRLLRGAASGSGIFRGLGRSLAFASTAFLGGTGFVFALRSSIKAAEDHQVVLGQLRAAVKAAGLDYDAYATVIEKAIRTQEGLGFTEESSTRSLITLIRATKNASEAQRLQNVAANVARATNKPLEVATNAVAKAYAGQSTQLRRLIPGLDSTAKGLALITDAQNRTAGSAKAFGDTAAGAQARFDVALHRTKVTIGTALLPVVTQYLTKAADWLDKSKNQKKIQDDVNAAIKSARGFVDDLRGAYDKLDGPVKAVVDLLGGIENTVKILVGLKLASVLRGWAAGFGLIGPAAVRGFAETAAASSVTTTKVVADAARMEAAIDTATRPRVLTVTERIIGATGGGTVLPGPGGPVYPGAPKTPTTPKFPGVPGAGGLAGLLLAGLSVGEMGETSTPVVAYDPANDQYYAVAYGGRLRQKISKERARKYDAAFVRKTERAKAEIARYYEKLGKQPGLFKPVLPTPAQSGTTPPPPALDAQSRIDLNVARARSSGNQAALLKALAEQAAFDRRYIKIQEDLLRRGIGDKKKHAATLQRLYGDLDSTQSEIQSIHDQNARKAKSAADKAQNQYLKGLATTELRLRNAVRGAKTVAGRDRAEDALIAFLRHEEKDPKLTPLHQGQFKSKALREIEARKKADADFAKGLQAAQEQRLKNAVTAAEIAVEKATKGTAAYDKAIAAEKKALNAEIRYYAQLAAAAKTSVEKQKDLAAKLAAQKQLAGIEKGKPGISDQRANDLQFLQSFQALQGFRNNFQPRTEMHLASLVDETRRNTKVSEELVKQGRYPASGYASASAASVYG